ncbi:restriction endonuclease subunit S [Klebsiella variicola subsp. variicola]|uniref:restriction endonuclease subunit S n=1 Tax=Klebsiella pneumoniae complex TaxID=3390273 RepID=UPI00292C5628|nr:MULTISPECIES: restriction endonuclease subunit S [Klebsiella]MDV0623086.1 restriction endonuclease subunit S [Klebsiella variicola subsp. variicola]HAV2258816.1 restriction endonuclease subunit S [Raoultella ornithinolytica]HBZ3705795.1 restriction endonuclease subunit S [Klebsiella quasipneumoniae]
MSELSYLEKLLDGADVEWLPLSDVCRFINGRAYKQEELLPQGKYPVLRVGNFFTNQNWYYSDLELEQDKYCDKGDLLYAWSASFGPRIWGEGKSIYHYHIWKVVPDTSFICKQFLYYLLQWDVKALKDAHSTGSTMMHVSKSAIEKRTVPIPCPNNPEKSLAIQSEIVRILDKFTALTAELTAELTARKKQYNYYRDQLLSFEEDKETEQIALGDIYDFKYGTGNTIPTTGGDYPVYGSNGIVGSHYEYNSEDSPVIGHIGAYAGIVNFGKGKHFVTYNGVICRHKSKKVLPQYAYYLLLLQNFGEKSNSASQPFVSYNILKAPIVSIPSLAEQARIVTILDKFDILTTSITEGLPREIELRQKQYEYYRDLLFSFPKPEAVTD